MHNDKSKGTVCKEAKIKWWNVGKGKRKRGRKNKRDGKKIKEQEKKTALKKKWLKQLVQKNTLYFHNKRKGNSFTVNWT